MATAIVPRTVEDVFKDYSGRRMAIIHALTRDVELFCRMCDPGSKNLCLYGNPNEKWEVSLPAEEVPPEMPEPTLGINIARDGMEHKNWVRLIAVHCDSWLISVAFFFAAHFNANERKRLFSLINDLPTVYEAVCNHSNKGKKKYVIERRSKSKQSIKVFCKAKAKPKPSLRYVEEVAEDSETLCGSCCGRYYPDEFWICCDTCDTWYHGWCVKITPEKAEQIQQYECPACGYKKGRK